VRAWNFVAAMIAVCVRAATIFLALRRSLHKQHTDAHAAYIKHHYPIKHR
jgi:hypothetical protein